jgi:mannosyltransferase OCH1-like enzyme
MFDACLLGPSSQTWTGSLRHDGTQAGHASQCVERGPADDSQPRCPTMKDLPRVVWMLWWQGWEVAPPLVRACRDSWQRHHPEW